MNCSYLREREHIISYDQQFEQDNYAQTLGHDDFELIVMASEQRYVSHFIGYIFNCLSRAIKSRSQFSDNLTKVRFKLQLENNCSNNLSVCSFLFLYIYIFHAVT